MEPKEICRLELVLELHLPSFLFLSKHAISWFQVLLIFVDFFAFFFNHWSARCQSYPSDANSFFTHDHYANFTTIIDRVMTQVI